MRLCFSQRKVFRGLKKVYVSMNRKLFRIIVYFFLPFLLYSSCCVCRLDWLEGLYCKEDHESHDAFITSNNSISNNGGKINKKKITHENLFIIGDVEKCKEVMEKLGADSCSEENRITIYNKQIIDKNRHNTFKFYLCGNGDVECEKIYKTTMNDLLIFSSLLI